MHVYQMKLMLPDEVIENLPADSQQWVPYLKDFFESSVLKTYEERFMSREKGSILGAGLSRYEKTMMLDFLIDMALGQLRESIELKNSSNPAEYSVGRSA